MKWGLLSRLFVLSALLLTGSFSLYAKKVTTKNKAPKTQVTEQTVSAPENSTTFTKDSDGFREIADKLLFLAYDKKASSSKETFFVENKSDCLIHYIELEITYLNTSGKSIHKRTAEITLEIPSGETRKIDIDSWDTQKSYHYINSAATRKGSTPYTVMFRVLSLTLSPDVEESPDTEP